MLLHTELCDRFGIEHPILNAPMGGGDAPARLAAAVSEAGGLGLIGGTTIGGVDWLVEQIRLARDLTDRPFGVGFVSHRPNTAELMAAALHEGVRIISHSFADPAPFVTTAHDAGALVLCQVRTVDDARRARSAGVDVVTAQGTEAGGHTGRISTLALVPVVVAASGGDTVLTDVFDIAIGMPWPAGVSGRAIRNDFADRWANRDDELRHWAAEHREEYRALGAESETAEKAVWAGEGVSFVTTTESAADVVRDLVSAATDVLRDRPAAVLRYP